MFSSREIPIASVRLGASTGMALYSGVSLDLPGLVRLVAEAPARLLGLFPRKGAIRPHSDADLVLVDPDREWTLAESAIAARSAVSPYVGRRFAGRVVRTVVRGVTVQLDGEIVARPGQGRLVTP